MKRTLIALALVAALLSSAVAPSFAGRANAASHTRAHAALFDKTRFLLHAGIAFFAVHHVYKKYKAGAFNSGAPHRVRTIVANGALLLIGYHEAKVAYGIAEKSNSKTLHAVIAPLNALTASLGAIGAKFKKGQYSSSDVTSLESQTDSVGSVSSKAGYTITDHSVPLPSGS